MSSLENIVRDVHRAGRSIDGIARAIANGTIERRGDISIEKASEVLHWLEQVRAVVVAADPELDFHHEPKREPTKYMKQVRKLAALARDALDSGDMESARSHLRHALDMEPPGLDYEQMSEKLDELERQ